MRHDVFLEFIRGTIQSVWAVEILLLLRADRSRVWTSEEIVKELRASSNLVTGVLETFSAAGLVDSPEPGRFVYAPASSVLEECCETLERAYRERPVSVVNAIVSSSTDKLQNFADAFRLKREGG